MRLIDADELKKVICKSCELLSEHLCSTEGDVKGCLAEVINNAPTVDAVAVVRCKECKHFDGKTDCHLYDEYGADSTLVRPKYFCSHGERKKENVL